MDWNVKTPSQLDWESLKPFSVKAGDALKQGQASEWGSIENGPLYWSAGRGCSGSEVGYGSSSKSSISASINSSWRAVACVPVIDFRAVSKDPNYRKKLSRVEDSGTSLELTSSVGSAEPLIGLKLGKRTYFENVCNANTVKAASFLAAPVPSNASVKKSRVSHQTVQNTCCQVEGCNVDLSTAKDYHRKHKVCENHSKCPKVIVAGQECRFCQQCSRLHDLSEFDQKKRSCRRRLSDHNVRRRKPPPGTISFNATRLSSSFYDDRQQMDLLLNISSFGHMRSANSTWESSCDFKLTQEKGPWTSSNKTRGIGGQLYLPSNELSTTASTFRPDLDRLLPFKSTTAEVLSQDDRQQMNLLLNRSPFGHMRLANSTWESSCDFKLTQAKGPWTSSKKTGSIGGQLYLPSNELSTIASTFHPDLDGLLPFKSTTAEVLSQDDRKQMNLLLNRSPFGHMRSANSTRESSCDFKLTQAKGPWTSSKKTGGIGGQLYLPSNELSTTASTFHPDLDGLLPFKSTTAEVLSQGLEASVIASNLDGASDLHHAYSLLSADSCGSSDSRTTSSINQLTHVNSTSAAQSGMHVMHPCSDYWQAEQPLAKETRAFPFTLHGNGSQFQEFQLLKTPYETGFFDSNQIH